MCDRLKALATAMSFGMALAAAAPLAAEGPAKRIRVFVVAAGSDSGFVDTKATEREHAVRDVRESIVKKRKDWLELVDAPERADVRIEVAERLLEDSGRVESTTTASSSTNKKGNRAYGSANTTTRTVQNYVLRAVLVVGEYREELEGAVPDTYILGGPWRTAANHITEEVEKFARSNYDKLLSRRER